MGNKFSKEFNKVFFTECRGVIIHDDKSINDETLIKALTVNENLKTMGFTFCPADIIRLAKYDEIDTIYESISGYVPNVKARPMYPDFPQQVMEMDEAVFRFHQMLHYFSTYGLERISGKGVTKGWLPEVEETEKYEDDDTLLTAKTIKLFSTDEAVQYIEKILNKKERLTIPEAELVKEAVPFMKSKIDIPFKENIYLLIKDDLVSGNNETVTRALLLYCSHPGDILDMMEKYLNEKSLNRRLHGYSSIDKNHIKASLSTSQRKGFIRALEAFDSSSLEDNFVRKRERNIILLEKLNLTRYKASDKLQEVAKALRTKQLRTFESNIERAISADDKDKVLELYSSRPGMLVRSVARLYKLGYDMNKVKAILAKNSDRLKEQTILTTLNYFGGPAYQKDDCDEDCIKEVYDIFYSTLVSIFTSKALPIADKKVFIKSDNICLEQSNIMANDKSDEGGYIRSGLAFKIPDTVKVLRFLVYWNDKKRIDIDLHSYIYDSLGNDIHIGWNGYFKKAYAVTSGDLTVSDSTEYVDIDIDKALADGMTFVRNQIHSFTEVPFNKIETVFTGMQAVSKTGTNIKQYNPKNLFFYHELNSSARRLDYADIDLKNRVLRLCAGTKPSVVGFSLASFINILLNSQNCTLVTDEKDAEIILTMGKPASENEISLIDSNYFLDN